MAALVYVVACCWLADKYKRKWEFICGLSAVGCILFIAVITVQDRMAQYVLTIFAFGTIYGCSPLVKTWVSDVIPQPAAKRAIAIALINSIGNASSMAKKGCPSVHPRLRYDYYLAGRLVNLHSHLCLLFQQVPC